jgi:hypothetical protein
MALEKKGGFNVKDDFYCRNCGANWSQGQFSVDCQQCGGEALEVPCLMCDGTCGRRFDRAIVDSQDYNKAHWVGHCGYQCDCSYSDDRDEARYCPSCGKRTIIRMSSVITRGEKIFHLLARPAEHPLQAALSLSVCVAPNNHEDRQEAG